MNDIMQKVIEVLEKEKDSILNINRLADNIRQAVKQEKVLNFSKEEAVDTLNRSIEFLVGPAVHNSDATKEEAINILNRNINYMIENDDLDGLAQILSQCYYNSNVRIKNSKVYNTSKEVF